MKLELSYKWQFLMNMDIVQFLKTETAALPKCRSESDKYFPSYLEKIFDNFLSELNSITTNDRICEEVQNELDFTKEIAGIIQESVKQYYNGLPHKAFQCIKIFFEQNETAVRNLCGIGNDGKDISGDRIFRMRIQDTGSFSRENMFHLPFDLRHKAATQRYSIPGYPCLYAANSLYTCWKELGSPPFDSVYSVRLETPKSINILDFGYTPKAIANKIENDRKSDGNTSCHVESLESVVLPKIIFWPLIAACSVQVLYPKEPFKPEYIIPQILLQLIKEDTTLGIDGIRYFSMYYDQIDPSIELGCNFAFPVKTNDAEGHCSKLKQMFEMTEVLPWQIANELRLGGPFSPLVPSSCFELVKGCKVKYSDTLFGKMEAKSYGRPEDPMSEGMNAKPL